LVVVLGLAAETGGAPPQAEVLAKTAKVKVRKETIATVKKGERYRMPKTQGPWVAIVMGEGDELFDERTEYDRRMRYPPNFDRS
jgi:hypothetical protein